MYISMKAAQAEVNMLKLLTTTLSGLAFADLLVPYVAEVVLPMHDNKEGSSIFVSWLQC